MALIAGIQAPPGRVMGHAGAFIGAGERKAIGKVKALESAGVVITNHPSKFGEEMKRLLGSEAYRTPSVSDILHQRPNYNIAARKLTRVAITITQQSSTKKHAHSSKAYVTVLYSFPAARPTHLRVSKLWNA